MLKVNKVPWGVKAVLIVLVLRLITIFVTDITLPLAGLRTLTPGSLIDRIFLIGLTVYMVLRVYRGGWQDLGLKNWKPAQHIPLGILAGFGLYIFFIFTRSFLGPLLGQDLQAHPLVRMAAQARSPLALAAPLLLGGVLAPVSEEIFYRGFAFPAFSGRLGVAGGIAASAVFFTIMHFSLAWWPEIVSGGLLFAVLYAWTGSLYPGMIAHIIVNSVQLLLSYLA